MLIVLFLFYSYFQNFHKNLLNNNLQLTHRKQELSFPPYTPNYKSLDQFFQNN